MGPQRTVQNKLDMTDCYGRQTGVLTVQNRFDNVPDDGFYHDEQRGGQRHHCPTRVDRYRQRNGEERGDECANEGDEPHQGREDAPQYCVGNPDQPKADAYDNTETSIEQRLHQEEATESRRRVIEGCGAALKVCGACQAQKTVANIFLLQEDEQEKQYHQRSHG